MAHTNRHIDRQINLILDQAVGIESSGVDEFIALVDRLREEVILAIVQGGEIDSYTAMTVKGRLGQILQTYETKFRDLMTENQRRMFVRGIQVVDKAVETGSILLSLIHI